MPRPICNQSHSAATAVEPVLRARPIWLTGSKITLAPAAAATAAVESVELLSQTIISHRMSAGSREALAARRMDARVSGNSFSSFQAGMMMERSMMGK